MKKKVRISVTQSDIKRGIPEKGSVCPIALSIKRKLKLKDFYVLPSAVINGEDNVRIADLPKEARDFIYAFDRNKEVSPFSFDIYIKKIK